MSNENEIYASCIYCIKYHSRTSSFRYICIYRYANSGRLYIIMYINCDAGFEKTKYIPSTNHSENVSIPTTYRYHSIGIENRCLGI